jgi:poly-gamma-glutamate system protein
MTSRANHPITAQARFTTSGMLGLLGLFLALLLLWLLALPGSLTPEENRLWQRVRAAQLKLAVWREVNNCGADSQADPWRLGLIGVEWSPLTTTLGDLSAKRTACNPAWAIWLRRQLTRLGLAKGDRVAIFSSASFPGLILSSLAAAEDLELDILLVVSLGASTWGANHPACPWPVLEEHLEAGGFIKSKAAFYTLGGGDELGGGMPPEARKLLKKTAEQRGVNLLSSDRLEGIMARKQKLLDDFNPSLLISLGGSMANLGTDPAALKLPPGLLSPSRVGGAGNGIIGLALDKGLPVIHMLNLRKLSGQAGIPYDREPRPRGPGGLSLIWCGLGVLVYVLTLWFHRRWRLVPLGNRQSDDWRS